MFTGVTVATITGAPIGTFIGQQFWQFLAGEHHSPWNYCLKIVFSFHLI